MKESKEKYCNIVLPGPSCCTTMYSIVVTLGSAHLHAFLCIKLSFIIKKQGQFQLRPHAVRFSSVGHLHPLGVSIRWEFPKKRRVASCKKLAIVTGFLKIGICWAKHFQMAKFPGRCARHHADVCCAHACISEKSDTVIEMGTISTVRDLYTSIIDLPESYSTNNRFYQLIDQACTYR